MPVYWTNLDVASDGSWYFPLMVETNAGKGQYTPRSDASLQTNKFPHLVLEVTSETNRSDRFRMLLQAACLAKLGNAVRMPGQPPFIVSAIYIDDNLTAKSLWILKPVPKHGGKPSYISGDTC